MRLVTLTEVALDELLQSFRTIVKEEIKAESQKGLEEKLLSPAEACKLFQPSISKVTLAKWTRDGLLQEHRIGGRVFYKYSDVMASLKTLVRYKTKSRA